MRTQFLILMLLVSGITGFAQQRGEKLSPLYRNMELEKPKMQKAGGADSTYVYLLDTITLPFLDDFSTNKFKQYDATPSDTNVSDTVFYRVYDITNTTILDDTVKYMLDTTYNIVYDSVTTDSMSITYNPLPLDTVWVHDISQYPITESEVEVWPRYNVIDTVWLGKTDTVYIQNPELTQDSSRIFFVRPGADQSIWVDNKVYLNDRYAIRPPTYGVATFDGLDSVGYPYDFSGTFAPYGVADYLTSKPIDLTGVNDSLYFSFFYQATGRGNEPNPEDSLVLEFWSPVDAEWKHIWSTPGQSLDTFKVVHILIDNPDFKTNGFQFRFYNYADLSGGLDHWHVDYVYLNEFRAYDDYVMKDLAFVYPGLSLIKDYTAMPWKHFKWDPSGNMKDTTELLIRNNADFTKNLFNRTEEIDFQGSNIASFNFAPVNPNVAPFTFEKTNFEVNSGGTNFVYDTSLADTCAVFTVRHIIETTTLPEQIITNDTTEFEQEFCNYYAYDDGSAEAAYGTFGGNSKVAYKFTIPQGDSLRGVLMHWEPSVNDASNETFWLTVWDDNGGEPGNIIHESNELPFHKPIYVDGPNGFAHYFFDNNERIFVNGTFYIGWQQQNSQSLNIGFDKNNHVQDNIFYNVSGPWSNTSFEGALMIRPVFVSEKDNLASVESVDPPKFNIYPNPANNLISIYPDDPSTIVDLNLMDMSGRTVYKSNNFRGGQVDVSDLSVGVYLLHISDVRDGVQTVEKIVIRR